MANFIGLKQMFYAERYGDLYWHKFIGGADGRKLWAPGFATVVGTGFNAYKPGFVFSGGFGGVIYGVKPNGDLFWHRHDGAENGTTAWGGPGVGGAQVGKGWHVYRLVFAIWNVIYGVTPSGELHWYRHDGWLDGSATWATGSGRMIGAGWNYQRMFASGSPNGALLYACDAAGDLYWYRHPGWFDGGPAPTSGPSPMKVGNGWNSYRIVFSQSPAEFPGIVYGKMDATGELAWYRHEGWADGSARWASGGGGRVIESSRLGGWFGSFNVVFSGHHRLFAQGEEGPVSPPVKDEIVAKRRRLPP